MTRMLSRNELFPRGFAPFALARSVFEDPFFAEVMPVAEEVMMPVDVSEDEKFVIVRASMPGYTKEQVTAEIVENVLTIKAEREEEAVDEGETFYRKERRFGAMSRRIALPSPVVEGEAKAELVDGVLTVRAPKTPKAVGKKVLISAPGVKRP
jgi:HSP20 family protein